MKNNLLKYYIVAFCLCSNFALFAQQPGSGDGSGGLEDADAPAAPIDDYLWVLILAGLIFAFMKLRAIQKKNLRN